MGEDEVQAPNPPHNENQPPDPQQPQAGHSAADAAEPTGHPPVDQALSRLSELPDLPLHEHAAVFEQVHNDLREALGSVDQAGGPAAPDS